MIVDEPVFARRDAEGDQVLAHQAHASGFTVVLGYLAGHERWQPVLAHELAHRRTGADSAQKLVVLSRQHSATSFCRSEATSMLAEIQPGNLSGAQLDVECTQAVI